MVNLIENNLVEIKGICRQRSVEKLFLFGSALSESFDEESDIDLLVEFNSYAIKNYADNYLDMCYELEALLNRKVDLVTVNSVKNPIFKREIDKSKKLIYQA